MKLRPYALFLALSVATVGTAWSGSGLVALSTAAPSCPNTSGNVYVNCNNGTVTDNRTGLVWLRDARCFGGVMDWNEAMATVVGLADDSGGSVADCGLSDGSSPGDWRLPSASEWRAMMADAVALGCTTSGVGAPPAITDDTGTTCWQAGPGNSFTNVQMSQYWTSATGTPNEGISGGFAAIYADTESGQVTIGTVRLKTDTAHVWPVRGGQ